MADRPLALVVDDDAGIRILVSRILSRKGFSVETARDGGEAIEKILQQEYALVILDLMMPRIDGFAVVRYLTEHRPEMLERVIVMSAFGMSAIEKVCPPIVRYVEKPFDIETLVSKAVDCGQPKSETASDDRAAKTAREQ